ncbi:hypothetical protein [Planctomicrobium piriforme]|uniref:Uncharacterized protein n=1 Tax=Planctomicrobium piriforme TaxID=1576369 RepID=A0A1I3KC01_9PLAN|nr:hypothetical protein [Planctomicrobium piriforme]SFI69725.1 hypothetical protein SAMN05421753_111174 [Planctomicrobium piriforme]
MKKPDIAITVVILMAFLVLLIGYAELYRRTTTPFMVPHVDEEKGIRWGKSAPYYSAFEYAPSSLWLAIQVFFMPAYLADRQIRPVFWADEPPSPIPESYWR